MFLIKISIVNLRIFPRVYGRMSESPQNQGLSCTRHLLKKKLDKCIVM